MVTLEADLGIEDAKALVRRAITQLGTSVEVVGRIERDLGDASLYVVVLEKFFLRNGSYAGLTVVVTGDGRASRVEAIPSGAGEGVFNIGLGAAGSFARSFADAMREAGYA